MTKKALESVRLLLSRRRALQGGGALLSASVACGDDTSGAPADGTGDGDGSTGGGSSTGGESGGESGGDDTRSPATGQPTTAMRSHHGQRLVDDEFWTDGYGLTQLRTMSSPPNTVFMSNQHWNCN